MCTLGLHYHMKHTCIDIKFIFISVIRRINVETMVEPAESQVLNPVLLYGMVSDCLAAYNRLSRGSLPTEIVNLLNSLEFVQDQQVGSNNQIIRGQYEERVRGFRLDSTGNTEWVWFDQTGDAHPLTNIEAVRNFAKDELKTCSDKIIRQLRGRDDRGEGGQVFSNWPYVVLCAKVFDHRQYKKRPADYESLFPDRQLNRLTDAEDFRKDKFVELFQLRKQQICDREGISCIPVESDIMLQWGKFQRHVFLNFDGHQSREYHAFWETCHTDDVLKQEAGLVLALNTVVNTECGSNAIAEHLGHMTNIVTRADRQRLKPLSASSEMVISYLLPSLPDIKELKLHSKIARLWRAVGGRDPCGSKKTLTFKKSGILLKKPCLPKKRKGKATKYYKREKRLFNTNKLRRGFFNRM